MAKTSTKGRAIGIAAAVAIGLAAVGVVLFLDSGGESTSGEFTPVTRDLQIAARDVLRAVQDWQDAQTGGGDGATVDLTVVLRERGVNDLPDDMTIVVCPELNAWIGVQAATAFAPLVAAKCPSGLGSSLVLYDGKGIQTVGASGAPAWATAAGGIVWTKKDLAGSEKSITLKR